MRVPRYAKRINPRVSDTDPILDESSIQNGVAAVNKRFSTRLMLRAVFILVVSLSGVTAQALLNCPRKPCSTAETCAKVADWIVEGEFTVQGNGVILRDAVLVRGKYRWIADDFAWLADASPRCWGAALPRWPFSETAKHLIGKRVRAYGSNRHEAFVDPGVLVLETIQ